MLDFDASKLLIIGVVALIVIGPKDLPRVLRQAGQMVSKLRRMASEFQGQFMDAMKEADLQDLREEVSKLKDTAKLDVVLNPVRDLRADVDRALDASALTAGALPPAAALTAEAPPSVEAVATPPEPASHLGEPDRPAGAEATGLRWDAAPAEGSRTAVQTLEAAALTAAPHVLSSAEPTAPGSPARRRVIHVAKRRSPGDRVGPPHAVVASRSRNILPPRRDPRP